jgi:hypothetical protein
MVRKLAVACFVVLLVVAPLGRNAVTGGEEGLAEETAVPSDASSATSKPWKRHVIDQRFRGGAGWLEQPERFSEHAGREKWNEHPIAGQGRAGR